MFIKKERKKGIKNKNKKKKQEETSQETRDCGKDSSGKKCC